MSQRAARGGYLWLSFVLVTSLLVLLWVTVLAPASKLPHYKLWNDAITSSLHYDLKSAELAMVCAQVFTFVGVPLFGLAVYFSSHLRRLLGFPKSPGQAAHRMVGVFLIAGPCALLAATLFIIWDYFTQTVPVGAKILEIYQMSALRIPALLAFLLPGVRVIADIVGDVLFHVQPADSEISSHRDTAQRLQLLLTNLAERKPRTPVLILAHSQGSVITWGVLNQNPPLAEVFVSVGSPLTSLYGRFIGAEYGKPYALGLEWHNLYREGDYVGWEIDGCPDNRDIGPGAHTGYWSDDVFARHFDECLSSGQQTRMP